MYATASDIERLHGAEFLFLVGCRGPEEDLTGPLTQAAIASAVAQASSECDGYLSVRYPTPVDPVPAILSNAVINMSVYHLASTNDRMTDIIRERYRSATSWLKDISAGRANLPAGLSPDSTVETSTAAETIGFQSQPPYFKGGWGR